MKNDETLEREVRASLRASAAHPIPDDLVARIRAKIAEERAAVKRETEKKAHIQEGIHKKAEDARPRPAPPVVTPAAPGPVFRH